MTDPETIAILDEAIRSALDVLTGFARPRSPKQMIEDATSILNDALRQCAT